MKDDINVKKDIKIFSICARIEFYLAFIDKFSVLVLNNSLGQALATSNLQHSTDIQVSPYCKNTLRYSPPTYTLQKEENLIKLLQTRF